MEDMACKKNNNMELLKQGAEARLYKTVYLNRPTIIKERFKKKYRINSLDENILKERMKAEARGLLKSKAAGVRSPALYMVDIDTRRLYLEYIEGNTVKDYIEELLTHNKEYELVGLAKKIGSAIAKLHKNSLIHGDLTTCNMIINPSRTDLFLIDFGLSFVSTSVEDKGVDLYVLERALTSSHDCPPDLFGSIIKEYCEIYGAGGIEIVRKYKEVQARGRKRTMVG